jgi:hypothetical protein
MKYGRTIAVQEAAEGICKTCGHVKGDHKFFLKAVTILERGTSVSV